MNFTIYHNPRCKKSRETLQILRDEGIDPEVVEYLKTPLDQKELSGLCTKLKIKPNQLLRKSEKIYKENFGKKELSDSEAIQAMVDFPKLMERPVVVSGDSAVVGRPPENVKGLL